MKRITFFILLGLIAVTTLSAQNSGKEQLKQIEVVGSAEMEIVPDEIFFSIALQEYKPSNNKKVDISTLEKQLVKAVRQAGIDDEDFQIENVYGWNQDYWRKKDKKDEEFLAQKRYRLKLSNLNKINGILAQVDPEGIAHANISDYSHSNIEEYRKELKIKALKAAKDKAEYLLQSIDEELGEALKIQEVEMGGGPYYAMRTANVAFETARGEADTDIGFKKIKLQYQIRASFRIR